MPCYQTNLMSVEFKAENHDLLFKALDALNLPYVVLTSGEISVTTPDGRITIGTNGTAQVPVNAQSRLNNIKVEYARQIVYHVASKRRLTVTEKEENRFVLRSRS